MLLKTVLHVGQRQDRDKTSKKSKGKLLSPPVPRKCSESEWASESGFSSHLFFLGPKRFRFQGHNYFYSGDVAPYKKIKYDWLDGRNFCRWLLVVNCGCVTATSLTNQGILHGSGFLGDSARERLHSKLAWVTQFNLHLDVWEVSLQSYTVNHYHHKWTSGFVTLTAATGQIWSQSTSKGGFGQAQIRRSHQPTKSMRGKLLFLTKNKFLFLHSLILLLSFSYRWDYKPWSTTGHLKKDQPDNAEFGINK